MIDVCNIQVMKPLLAQYGFHFSKAKGQNFLIAGWVPQQIAEDAGVDATAGVLEIGPGIGPLTQQLALRAGKVCAVELDFRLKPILELTVGEFDNLEILWDDVLKQDIPALVKEKFAGLRPMACANLPYYITTPILMRLLESGARFDTITVMVQKEVAERLSAAPGSSDYGAITAQVGYYGTVKRLFKVPAGCFVPSPKVDSAVVRIDLYRERKYNPKDEKLFHTLIKAAFEMRRKTLVNAISAKLPHYTREKITEAILAIGKPADVRGERLSTEDFVRLSDFLSG